MDFIPENELEAALVAAATEPAARPRFYEVLSKSNLYIIDENPQSAPREGPQVLEKGRALQVRQLDIEGVPHVPVFSSPARISSIVEKEVRFLAMNAKNLFKVMGGAHLILNPGSQFGKQFTPEEMAQVLDGSIFAPRSSTVVPEDRQVLLGQPTNYPTHVTGPLAAFFETKKEVRAAYLAHVFDPKSGDGPHTVIGVDVDPGADFSRLMGEVSLILDGVANQGELIDFIRITGEGISDYMTKETKPFYRK